MVHVYDHGYGSSRDWALEVAMVICLAGSQKSLDSYYRINIMQIVNYIGGWVKHSCEE